MKRSVPPRRTSLPRRTRPAKKRNDARKAREFRRCFWSAERVAYIRTLPCVVTRALHSVANPIDNAHIPHAEGAGAGRRGNADQIVPMLRSMHRLLHSDPVKFWQIFPGFDPVRAARWTEAMWRCYAEANGLPHAGASE